MRSSEPNRGGSIFFEVQNLASGLGTGIRTYARNLGLAATRLGYHAHAVIGVPNALRSHDLRLTEVLAFDAAPERATLGTVVGDFASLPLLRMAGQRLTEVPRSGLVIRPDDEGLRPFEGLFAARRLMETAVAHFRVFGRPLTVRLPATAAAFQTTSVVALAARGCPNLYTIHDLVPLRLPYTTLDNKKLQYALLNHLAKTADHIVTVSEFSRTDIIRQLGVDEDRVTNTYQPVDVPPEVLGQSIDELSKTLESAFGLEVGKYFVFYGSIEPKKNISRLIDAYAQSGTKWPLVIAGAEGWQNRAEMRKVRASRFVYWRVEGDRLRRESQVRNVGYLSNPDLMALVRGARALLFPSIYEGFGLPVLEAMTLGTPVVTSNLSSLPEIAGEAALLVDPYSVDSISEAIVAVDSDPDLRLDLVRRGNQQAQKFSTGAYDARVRELYTRLGI